MLEKLIRNNEEIFTTKEILEEFVDVLKREFLYNEDEANNLVGKVLQFLTLVSPNEKIDIIQEDPDDNKILECAVESEADYIITYDKHLLKLKEYHGIKIVRPEGL